MALVNFYGQEGGIFIHDGITMYPKMQSVWGEDALLNHSQDFNADIAITCQDIWTLDMNIMRQVKRWIPFVPIDHEPTPPAVIEHLKLAYRIIAMSEFGKKQMERDGFYSTYIPHSVNTEILKPLPDKEKIKKELGLPPDFFIFGMVSANKDYPPRKSYQEVMDAFKKFHDANPKSGLFMHINILQGNVFPIDPYAKFLGIENNIFHLPPYPTMYKVTKDFMTKIYNAFDCLVAPSTNEGFGVPIIEAQSCGTPVITNNFTAMPEHVINGETGYIVNTAYKYFTPMLSYIGIPDTQEIYESMMKVYKADSIKMAKAARENILKHYDLDTIYKEKWSPFLTKIENEIYPQTIN